MKFFLRAGMFFLCSSWTFSVFSKDLRWTHFGLRPLAMGNAFVSVADDYNALFYNPAGLAWLESWDGEFLNPALGVSQETMNFASDMMELAQGKSKGASELLEVFEKQVERNNIYLSLQWTPHLIFPGIGFGAGLDWTNSLNIQREIAIQVEAAPTVIAPIAYAHNFFEKRLAFGATLKGVVKGGVEREFSLEDVQTLADKGFKLDQYVIGGMAVGADFGILFRPIKPLEPTLGVSITDFGNTKFKQFNIQGSATGAPDTRMAAVNTGVSFKPLQFYNSYVLTSVDVHAINQAVSFSKKLNLGVEYGFSRIIKVGMGLHDGYLSGGFQFDVGLLNVRATTYGAEMGEVAGIAEDRRYLVQIKLII